MVGNKKNGKNSICIFSQFMILLVCQQGNLHTIKKAIPNSVKLGILQTNVAP